MKIVVLGLEKLVIYLSNRTVRENGAVFYAEIGEKMPRILGSREKRGQRILGLAEKGIGEENGGV